MTVRNSLSLVLPLVIAFPTALAAADTQRRKLDTNVDAAERAAAQSGRPILAIAGSKT